MQAYFNLSPSLHPKAPCVAFQASSIRICTGHNTCLDLSAGADMAACASCPSETLEPSWQQKTDLRLCCFCKWCNCLLQGLCYRASTAGPPLRQADAHATSQDQCSPLCMQMSMKVPQPASAGCSSTAMRVLMRVRQVVRACSDCFIVDAPSCLPKPKSLTRAAVDHIPCATSRGLPMHMRLRLASIGTEVAVAISIIRGWCRWRSCACCCWSCACYCSLKIYSCMF